VVDSAGAGWKFFISPLDLISADLNTQNLIPNTSDLPLGRVFFAVLVYKTSGQASIYINGRFLVSTGAAMDPVTAPVSIIVGSSGAPNRDFIEYLGFAFIDDNALSTREVGETYIACQDAGRVAIPPALVIETNYVVYNADTGLTNLALWVPEINTMGAPSLPAIPNGIATGTLLTAPFHVAHSGWAAPPAP
jgi:hypothetical protein